jgi:hypothetical protein
MNGPLDEATLNALHSNFRNSVASPTTTQKKKKGRGGTATSLISEGGGLGGALAGGATGAALGSVVPVIGTAVGGLIGAGVGGFLGGTGGRIVENKVRDDRVGLGDALKEGAFSGITGAGPLRLAKFAGVGAKTALAGKGLASALAAGGESAVAPSIIKTAIAGKLDKTADSLAQRGMKMNESGFGTKFADRTGEEVGSALRRYNIPKLGVKGAQDKVLQPGFDAHAAAVASIGSIPKSEVLQQVQAQVAKKAASPDPVDQAFAKTVIERTNGILDNLPENISATQLNELKSGLASQVNHGATDSASINTNQLLDHISTGFRKTINSAADRAGITADSKLTKLGYKSTKVGDLGEELNNLSELLGQANKKSRVGAGSSPISLISTMAAASPGGIPAAAAVQALNSNTGRSVLAKGADKLAVRAEKKAVQSGIKPFGVKQVAKRAIAGDLAALPFSGGQDQSNNAQTTTDTTTNPSVNNIDKLSQNQGQNAISADEWATLSPEEQQFQMQTAEQTGYTTDGRIIGEDIKGGAAADSADMFSPTAVKGNIQKILAGGGTMKDVAQYLDIAQTVQKMQADSAPAGSKPLNSTQLQQANNAQSGVDSLNTIFSTLKSNPNASKLAALPGGSLASALTGTGQYKAAISNATDVIGRLRSGGAINADEEKRFRSLLPGSFDDQKTIDYKLQSLNNLFQRFINPQAAATPDQADLVSALGL